MLSLCGAIQAFVGVSRTLYAKNSFEVQAKQKFKINTNISGNVSSDGLLADKKKEQEKQIEARSAVKSNLGVSRKKKMSSNSGSAGDSKKKLSMKAQKLAEQRNGSLDSTLQAGLSRPEDQDVQVQVAKRGSKQVTLVRGLTDAMDNRKTLLKEMKSKLGGGGAMIEGVVSSCRILFSCKQFFYLT
jgi:translation initiation factor 1 (eIF-1/SUI1)